MAAAARFLVWRLWTLKMSSLLGLVGRDRPVDGVAEDEMVETGCWARREERVLVKFREEEELGAVVEGLDLAGWGTE